MEGALRKGWWGWWVCKRVRMCAGTVFEAVRPGNGVVKVSRAVG